MALPDHEVAMASAQLHEISHMANNIHSLLHNGNGDIKAWVQSKLTRAHHDLADVRTYLRGLCCGKSFQGDTKACGCMAYPRAGGHAGASMTSCPTLSLSTNNDTHDPIRYCAMTPQTSCNVVHRVPLWVVTDPNGKVPVSDTTYTFTPKANLPQNTPTVGYQSLGRLCHPELACPPASRIENNQCCLVYSDNCELFAQGLDNNGPYTVTNRPAIEAYGVGVEQFSPVINANMPGIPFTSFQAVDASLCVANPNGNFGDFVTGAFAGGPVIATGACGWMNTDIKAQVECGKYQTQANCQNDDWGACTWTSSRCVNLYKVDCGKYQTQANCQNDDWGACTWTSSGCVNHYMQ